MIWLKVKIPIPKLVVIYHQTDHHLSFLRPLKCTVRIFSFSFGQICLSFLPIQCEWLFLRLDRSIWRGAIKSIKYLVSFLSEFQPSMNCCYTSWWLQFLSTYFNLNYTTNILWMTLIKAWTVSGVKVVVLGADDENLSSIILSWVVFCTFKWKLNRNFIHATVKAVFFVLFIYIFH